MLNMKDVLKKNNPELFSSYQKSCEIARKEWLPMVNNNKGSSNSLPHLLGVEEQINMLLYSKEYFEIELTDAEIYVLLSAILLHDIGKTSVCNNDNNENCHTREYFVDSVVGCTFADLCNNCTIEIKDGEEKCYCCNDKKCPKTHAQISRCIIANKWYNLGIHSQKFADIIAEVCCFHDCDSDDVCPIHNDYYMERFGKIRGRLLGAILVLGDHLDDSYTRAAPDYFDDYEKPGVIGRLRNRIQYTRIDKANKMICSIIDEKYLRVEDIVPPILDINDLISDYNRSMFHNFPFDDLISSFQSLYLHITEFELCVQDYAIDLDKFKKIINPFMSDITLIESEINEYEKSKNIFNQRTKSFNSYLKRKTNINQPDSYIQELESSIKSLETVLENNIAIIFQLNTLFEKAKTSFENINSNIDKYITNYSIAEPFIKQIEFEIKSIVSYIQNIKSNSYILQSDIVTMKSDIEELKLYNDKLISYAKEDPWKESGKSKHLCKNRNVFCSDETGNGDYVNTLFDDIVFRKGYIINNYQRKYAAHCTMASLLSHTFESYEQLKRIRGELYTLNCPIKKWYIECNGHLFETLYSKEKGFIKCIYVVEPILSDDYCDDVFAAMFNLTRSIYGVNRFTYYDILNYTHGFPESIEKIKCAVKRISKIFDFINDNGRMFFDKKVCYKIDIGVKTWAMTCTMVNQNNQKTPLPITILNQWWNKTNQIEQKEYEEHFISYLLKIINKII